MPYKYARVEYERDVFFGLVDEENGIIAKLRDDGRPGDMYGLDEVSFLPPVAAPNIIAVGLNYRSHASEAEDSVPDEPVLFMKATTSLCGDGEAIILPEKHPDFVDYEAELAIIISRTARHISEAEAFDYILGFSCANDISARDCQLHHDKQWFRGKSFDTFCPVGPYVVTGIDPDNLHIESRLNGKVMQSANTSEMIFSTAKIVSFCSENFTLLPGTIILTGTPSGVGFARSEPVYLRDGDKIEVEIENIGTLTNMVSK